jgi:hypothetical protein
MIESVIILGAIGACTYWLFNHVTVSFKNMNDNHHDLEKLMSDCALKQDKNQIFLETKMRDIQGQIVSLAKDINQMSVEVGDEKKNT